MNQDSDQKNNAREGQDDQAPAEEAPENGSEDAQFDGEDVVAEPPSEPSRLPLIVAVAALGAALLALAGIALELSQPEPVAQERGADDAALASLEDAVAANAAAVDELRSAVEPLDGELATVGERLARLAADDSAAATDIDALQRRIDRQLAALESLPSRVSSIESTVSTLRGMSTGAQDAWLLAQAEYYLQVANAELELARNPAVAGTALEMADRRLSSVDDPGLTDVRRALSTELRALESLDLPDVSGTAVTLAGLSRIVESLPIRRQLLTKRPDEGSAGSDPGAAPAELTGSERALATLRNAFSGIVSVRRTDEKAEPLIAPEAVWFLQANLELQLQSARLALLRGEQELFDQSLDDVESWLREYYDTESTPVQSALTTIGEIRSTAVAGELPDISESLRLLRRYIAFREAEGAGSAGEEPQR